MFGSLVRRWAFRRTFDKCIGGWLAIAADVRDGKLAWPEVTWSIDDDPRVAIPTTITANLLALFVAYGIEAGMHVVILDHERGTYEVARDEGGEQRRKSFAFPARVVIAVVCDFLDAMMPTLVRGQAGERTMLRRLSDLVVEYPPVKAREVRILIDQVRLPDDAAKRHREYPFLDFFKDGDVAIDLGGRRSGRN